MKKNTWMISVVAILVLLGTESVCADSTVWLTENTMPEYDPMAASGEEEAPVTEADGKSVDPAPLEPQIKRQNDNGPGWNSDVRRDKLTRFGVGYEYRMRRNDLADRPDRPGR